MELRQSAHLYLISRPERRIFEAPFSGLSTVWCLQKVGESWVGSCFCLPSFCLYVPFRSRKATAEPSPERFRIQQAQSFLVLALSQRIQRPPSGTRRSAPKLAITHLANCPLGHINYRSNWLASRNTFVRESPSW